MKKIIALCLLFVFICVNLFSYSMVEIISADYVNDLQYKINNWLLSHSNYKIKNISFFVEGKYSYTYRALILYEK